MFPETFLDNYTFCKGLVDGTLIPIANPSVLNLAFICRYGFATINVQVVVDHRGMFADGKVVWQHTQQLCVGQFGQDSERGVFGQRILGDGGCPLSTCIF